jgi:hypothetical protein
MFNGCKKLTSIEIPSTVAIIGEEAFYECKALTTVKMSDLGIRTIGTRAFYGCSALKTVKLSSNLTEIGEKAFEKCSSLESIELPNTLKTLKEGAFNGCVALKSVNIPAALTELWFAFDGCTSIESFNVSEDNQAFMSIDGVIYTKDGTTICSYPCGKKDKTFIVPESVTGVGINAFEGNLYLEHIEFKNGYTFISNEAFLNCVSLKTIKLPEFLEIIPMRMAYGCTSLESILIPYYVNHIGDNAFGNCASLKVVYVDSEEIASELLRKTACEGLINNAESLFILEGFNIPPYVLGEYPVVDEIEYDGFYYASLSRHEHNWEKYKKSSEGGADGFKGHKCTECGALQGKTTSTATTVAIIVVALLICFSLAPYVTVFIIFIVLMTGRKKRRKANQE